MSPSFIPYLIDLNFSGNMPNLSKVQCLVALSITESSRLNSFMNALLYTHVHVAEYLP